MPSSLGPRRSGLRRGALIGLGATLLAGVPLLLGFVTVAPLLRFIAPSAVPHAFGAAADVLRPVLGPEALARVTPALLDWTTLGRLALAANVAIGVLRAWASLDAGLVAIQRRRAHALVGATAGPLAWLSPFAAALAAVVVVGPHATAYAVAEAARPLLVPVLVLAPPLGRNPTGAGGPGGASSGVGTPGAPSTRLETAALESAKPEGAAVAAWDSGGRLTVLLLGSDRRPREAGAPSGRYGNSDTLLVVSVEAGARSAALISIPRDLTVVIPGVGPEKINAAFREGGPVLAVRTVGALLGQPIHRWAAVDTAAFGRIVDALGGVVVDVERPIRDDEFPTEDYGVRRVFLPAGLSWLDGERALVFARSRHDSNDFDRADRQQRLMLALADRLRHPEMMRRVPALLAALSATVQTDVTPRELLALAGAAADLMPRDETVRRLVLAPPVYGQEVVRPDLYAIQPNTTRIRADMAQLLNVSPPPSAPLLSARGAGTPGPRLSQGGP